MEHSSPVRVRFAPSPTGYLHIGGLRTALYNHLFARRLNGAFILRIEDTDRSRYVKGAVENLIESLRWIGLSFDEGPEIGGEYGPYTQSERLKLYREHADILLNNGHAYRCFCTPEILGTMRSIQTETKTKSRYDGRCKLLSETDIRERLEHSVPFTVRMSIPRAVEVHFEDIVRGSMTVSSDDIDDQVLLKSDGYPTYHLANVVDDHFMRISHVIRGEEWLPSTSKHVLLYSFFGWNPPQFAHLPLLLNPDRSKLSKRQGDVAVEDYRSKGYLPQALANYVALLGWNTTDDKELYSVAELCETFSLERVGKAGAIFDQEKLRWFNAQYLKRETLDGLIDLCAPFLQSAYGDLPDRKILRRIVTAVTKYLVLPGDAVEHALIFFENETAFENDAARATLDNEQAKIVLGAFLENATKVIPWEEEQIKTFIKTIQAQTGVKGKELFMPIRVALTGRNHGPDIPLISEIFGRDKCMSRIERVLRQTVK